MKKIVVIKGIEHTIETHENTKRKGYYYATYTFYKPNNDIPNPSGAYNESMNLIEDTDENRLIERVIAELSRED